MVFDLALGARCETPEVVLRPGEVLEATIPVNLNMMIRATCPGGSSGATARERDGSLHCRLWIG